VKDRLKLLGKSDKSGEDLAELLENEEKFTEHIELKERAKRKKTATVSQGQDLEEEEFQEAKSEVVIE
jgi:hypothetical protein